MQEYYKDITVDNLDLVREQKADLAELRRREAAAVKQLAVASAENRRLAEPLQKVCISWQEESMLATVDFSYSLSQNICKVSAA